MFGRALFGNAWMPVNVMCVCVAFMLLLALLCQQHLRFHACILRVQSLDMFTDHMFSHMLQLDVLQVHWTCFLLLRDVMKPESFLASHGRDAGFSTVLKYL